MIKTTISVIIAKKLVF